MKSKGSISQTLIGLALTVFLGNWAVSTFMKSFNAAAASVKSYKTCDLGALSATTGTEAHGDTPLTLSMIFDDLTAGKTVTIKKTEDNCFQFFMR